MRILLDTHVFLWATADKLSPSQMARLNEAEEVYVSAASIWEIAIKAGIGKLDADPVFLAGLIEPSGFTPLPVTPAHAAAVSRLPEPADGHKDPFDRLLVAQALSEPLFLLTADRQLEQYGRQILLF